MNKKVPQYANVAPAMPLPSAGRQVFTYRLAANNTAHDLQLVQISVGRRLVSGVVINTHHQKPSYPTKPIARLYDASLTPKQLKLCQWVVAVNQGSIGYTARLFYPPSLAAGKPVDVHEDAPSSTNKAEQHLVAPFSKRLPHLTKLLKDSLKNGQQSLILVPEIWMIDRLVQSLIDQKISAQHLLPYFGNRKNSELAAIWNTIGQRDKGIVIGTQKALFLPWQSLRHIVVEEEAFDTHKLWDQYPRLDNRLAARELAAIHQADLVMTNSYPSLVSEGQKEQIIYKPLVLHPRLVPLSPADRRARRLLPNEFLPRLRTWWRAGDTILLLYNRRQEAEVTEKPGWQSNISTVADILKKLRFPASKILWLDQASVAKKNPATLAKQIKKARIIVSTSIIFTHAGEQRFDHVAWIFPEQTINYPDYRGVERARITLSRLQQLTHPRRAIDLLSRQPHLVEDHLLLVHDDWVKRELKLRSRYYYPPYTDIVRLTCQGKTQKLADQKARELRVQVKKNIDQQDIKERIFLRGPFKSLAKPKPREFRESHLLLQGPLGKLQEIYKNTNVDIVDPYSHQIL